MLLQEEKMVETDSNFDNFIHNDLNEIKLEDIEMVPELDEKNDITKLIVNKKCEVLNCDMAKDLEPNLLFRFPDDPTIRQIWINLTGRSNWTPGNHSCICVVHFSVDSFTCDQDNQMVLISDAVPSLRLPTHVLEVEYIDDNVFESESESEYEEFEVKMETNHTETGYGTINTIYMNGDSKAYNYNSRYKPHKKEIDIKLLKLFNEVQRMQRQAVGIKDKIKSNTKIYNRQSKYLEWSQQQIKLKKTQLLHKAKRKLEKNMPLVEKIQEERTDLILCMPTKHTDDLKNFALSVYNYSPQAYIYLRNTLRTTLPSCNVLENWIDSGYVPKNLMSGNSLIKVLAEQTETELTCKILLH